MEDFSLSMKTSQHTGTHLSYSLWEGSSSFSQQWGWKCMHSMRDPHWVCQAMTQAELTPPAKVEEPGQQACFISLLHRVPRCSQPTRITGQGHLFSGFLTFTQFCLELTHIQYHFNLFPVPPYTFPLFSRCCQNSFDFSIVTLLMLQQGSCGNVSAWICYRFLKR